MKDIDYLKSRKHLTYLLENEVSRFLPDFRHASLGDYPKIIGVLSHEDIKKLEGLLRRFLVIANHIDKGKLELTVANVEKIGGERDLFHKIKLVDNLDGTLGEIIPTYDFAEDIVGSDLIVYNADENPCDDHIEGNRVVSRWNERRTIPGFWDPTCGDYPDVHRPAAIILYSPESYVEEKGISVIHRGNNGTDDVKKFKEDLRQGFLRSNVSPIMHRVSLFFAEKEHLVKKIEQKKEEERVMRSSKIFRKGIQGKVF